MPIRSTRSGRWPMACPRWSASTRSISSSARRASAPRRARRRPSGSRTSSRTCSSCARSRSRTAWPVPASATSSWPMRWPTGSTASGCRSRSARPRRPSRWPPWRRTRTRRAGVGRSSTRAIGSRTAAASWAARCCRRSRTRSRSGRRSRQRDADAALLARGVAVRRYEIGPMAGWLRATARLEPEERRLLDALKEVMS